MAAVVTLETVRRATGTANRAMVLMWSQLEGWELAAAALLSLELDRLDTALP